MIKVSSLLIFNHFFQNLILNFIWRFYMKKEVTHLLFCMCSSLVIFCFMTMLGHMLPGWHCRSSITLDIRFCHIHHILLISHQSTTIYTPPQKKAFGFKGEVKITFKDFLSSTPLRRNIQWNVCLFIKLFSLTWVHFCSNLVALFSVDLFVFTLITL